MRVLVVEDEPDLLSALVQTLQEEGYAADQAADGHEGLFEAESSDYEAIILDLMLPGIDGLEILRRLRQQRRKIKYPKHDASIVWHHWIRDYVRKGLTKKTL